MIGKVAEAVRLLRARVTVAMFRHREAPPMRLHVEAAAPHILDGIVHFERDFRAVAGQQGRERFPRGPAQQGNAQRPLGMASPRLLVQVL